jgi:hypothetical protein
MVELLLVELLGSLLSARLNAKMLLPAASKELVEVWIQVASHQSLGKTSGSNPIPYGSSLVSPNRVKMAMPH